MGALPKIERGNAKPTAKQKAYHIWLMDNHDCMACGAYANHVHHPLMESPLQNGRRDHEFVVPICHYCHTDIHDKYGNEIEWTEAKGCELPVRVAEFHRLEAIAEGRL